MKWDEIERAYVQNAKAYIATMHYPKKHTKDAKEYWNDFILPSDDNVDDDVYAEQMVQNITEQLAEMIIEHRVRDQRLEKIIKMLERLARQPNLSIAIEEDIDRILDAVSDA